MKNKYLLIVLISFLSFGYGQKATMKIRNILSENHQFHIQVKGYSYGGFVGDQKISLIDSNNDTLWTQVVPRRFLIYPSVSNNGDVNDIPK